MTSLPLFHGVMVSWIRNLDHRRAPHLLAEPVGGSVPLLSGALGDVDLASEALLSTASRPPSETSSAASWTPTSDRAMRGVLGRRRCPCVGRRRGCGRTSRRVRTVVRDPPTISPAPVGCCPPPGAASSPHGRREHPHRSRWAAEHPNNDPDEVRPRRIQSRRHHQDGFDGSHSKPSGSQADRRGHTRPTTPEER